MHVERGVGHLTPDIACPGSIKRRSYRSRGVSIFRDVMQTVQPSEHSFKYHHHLRHTLKIFSEVKGREHKCQLHGAGGQIILKRMTGDKPFAAIQIWDMCLKWNTISRLLQIIIIIITSLHSCCFFPFSVSFLWICAVYVLYLRSCAGYLIGICAVMPER